jgi:hypothetical protein
MSNEKNFVLIVTIVKKGWGDEVIKASRKVVLMVEQSYLVAAQEFTKIKVFLA